METLLADSEDFRAAGGADALGCRSPVLHDNPLGILDLFLGSALHNKKGGEVLPGSVPMSTADINDG